MGKWRLLKDKQHWINTNIQMASLFTCLLFTLSFYSVALYNRIYDDYIYAVVVVVAFSVFISEAAWKWLVFFFSLCLHLIWQINKNNRPKLKLIKCAMRLFEYFRVNSHLRNLWIVWCSLHERIFAHIKRFRYENVKTHASQHLPRIPSRHSHLLNSCIHRKLGSNQSKVKHSNYYFALTPAHTHKKQRSAQVFVTPQNDVFAVTTSATY